MRAGTPKARRGAVLLALPVLVAILTGGCGDEPAQYEPLDAFVGKTDTSDVYVALLTDGDRIAGFLTDGREVSIWLGATDLDDGRAELLQRDRHEAGEVTIEGDSASGELRLGGAPLRFTARIATGNAGLYHVASKKGEDAQFQAGWVLLPDGTSRGSVDTMIDGVVNNNPAPRLARTVKIRGFGVYMPGQLTQDYLDELEEAVPGLAS